MTWTRQNLRLNAGFGPTTQSALRQIRGASCAIAFCFGVGCSSTETSLATSDSAPADSATDSQTDTVSVTPTDSSIVTADSATDTADSRDGGPPDVPAETLDTTDVAADTLGDVPAADVPADGPPTDSAATDVGKPDSEPGKVVVTVTGEVTGNCMPPTSGDPSSIVGTLTVTNGSAVTIGPVYSEFGTLKPPGGPSFALFTIGRVDLGKLAPGETGKGTFKKNPGTYSSDPANAICKKCGKDTQIELTVYGLGATVGSSGLSVPSPVMCTF